MERFTLGKLVMTNAIHNKMQEDTEFMYGVLRAFARYISGDFGELCDEDKAENEYAIKNGERIFAFYTVCGNKVYIITEWDRSATTILFANEY